MLGRLAWAGPGGAGARRGLAVVQSIVGWVDDGMGMVGCGQGDGGVRVIMNYRCEKFDKQ